MWHFEAIPRYFNKEIIGVEKPTSSPKTIEIAMDIVNGTDSGSSTLKDMSG